MYKQRELFTWRIFSPLTKTAGVLGELRREPPGGTKKRTFTFSQKILTDKEVKEFNVVSEWVVFFRVDLEAESFMDWSFMDDSLM